MLKANIVSVLLVGCLSLHTASAHAEEPDDIALDPRYPIPEFSAEEARRLASIMCGSISSPHPNEKRRPRTILEDTIVRFSDWDYETLDRKAAQVSIRVLWNMYEEHFICSNTLARQHKGHILKRIVQLGLNIPLLNDHFFSDENNPMPANVNTIETVERDGVVVRETLVDYLDYLLRNQPTYIKWFGSNQLDEIQILRDEILIGEFGAKRAVELE